ncbi:MAG TPA: hypothetical protein VN837_09445 [Chloroflexota bacterium]|nr:hypothetical protein [Chloroflexota bacterium]
MHILTSSLRLSRGLAAPFLVGMLAVPAFATPAAAHPSTRAIANLPCIPAGHGPSNTPSISFGRSGGNIRPMKVRIYGDGTITYQGAAPALAHYAITPEAVLGLQRLANAEGFWTMPSVITSTHVLPDLATLSITVRAGCASTTKTVQARGGQLGGFTELYDTLSAATALGNGTAFVPPTSPTAVPGPQAITQANNGEALHYTVGQRFVLELGSGDAWNLTFSTPGIVKRTINVAMILGAQGIYSAAEPGHTTLTAIGVPICPTGKICSNLARRFQVSVVVQAKGM